MTTTDSKGIIRYEAGDPVSPLHTTLNLGLDSVSTALDSPLYNTPAGVHVVANSTELTPLRTTMTAAGYLTSDPLYAHRKDVGELYVQETSSGSWVQVIPETSTVTVALASPFTTNTCTVTRDMRTGLATISFTGASGTPSGGSQLGIGNIPSGYRPSATQKFIIGSSGATNLNGRWMSITTSGDINIIVSGPMFGATGTGGSGLLGAHTYRLAS